jgi:IrrE N-terminal-like domain
LLASHLGVSVQEIDLKGVDGYVESFKGDYRVFLSSRAPFLRRRFTLCHELAHVIFMRTAKKGGIKDSYLVRYRRNGLPTSEFQDERASGFFPLEPEDPMANGSLVNTGEHLGSRKSGYSNPIRRSSSN